jgi:hypothetical protein
LKSSWLKTRNHAELAGFVKAVTVTALGWGLIAAAVVVAPPWALAQAQTPNLGVFTSVPKTFATASYWVQGPQGVVLIDTQFLPKEGLLALQDAERRSGQRVTHAMVLHPNPDNHAWLELGRIDDWLQRLDEIRALNPTRVIPGRGQAGGPELLAHQAEYLRFVQKLVQAEQPSGDLGWFTKQRLQRQIEGQYPTLGYPIFMRDGLAAVWREEASKRNV